MRYGKLKTAFRHFAVIADGEVVTSNVDFGTTAGSAAFFSMQAWAIDCEQATDMVVTIGRDVGFEASGRVYVYSTEPQQPPGQNPYAYGLNFNQYLR